MSKWSATNLDTFIQSYKAYPCLYDVKNPEYHNRCKRRDALERIVDVMKQYRPNFTVEDARVKIKFLHSQFQHEHKRLAEEKKGGAGNDDVLIPKFSWYKDLLFLLDSVTARKSKSKFEFLEDAKEDKKQEEFGAIEFLEETFNDNSEVSSQSQNDSIIISPEISYESHEVQRKNSGESCSYESSASCSNDYTEKKTPTSHAKKRTLPSLQLNTKRSRSSPISTPSPTPTTSFKEKALDILENLSKPKPVSKYQHFGNFIVETMENMTEAKALKLKLNILNSIIDIESAEDDTQ